MSPLPGDWRGAKDLFKKTATTVLDKTAALDIPATIHRSGLASGRSDASISHVPAAVPQQAPASCQENQSTPLRSLLTSCILVLLSLVLGWWCGVRQERWQQAMLRAQAADQETEELANISLAASVPSASIHPSSTAAVTSTHVTAQGQQGQSISVTQQPEPDHTATQSKQATALAPSNEAVQQTLLSLQQQAPQTEQMTSLLDQTGGKTPQHEAAAADAEQSSCAGAAESAASGHQCAASQQSNDADEQSSDAMLPFTAAAQTLDGPIESAAGVLIQKSCQAAAVSFMQLDPKDRVALVQQSFAVALNDYRQEQHHRSKLKENEQRAQHNALVSSGMDDTRMWRQGKTTVMQRLEEQRQLAMFQNTLSDCLMCGLTVMMFALIYCGVSLGFLQGRLSECQSKHRRNFWQVLSLVKAAQSVLCYGNAVGDLLISALVMIGLPWFVAKQSLLTEGVRRPMTGLILGLGVVCGVVGCFVVSRLGANYLAWLVPYEAWIATHVFVVSKASLLYRLLNMQQSQRCFWQQAEVRMPLYLAGMGFVAPTAVAVAPFWKFMV